MWTAKTLGRYPGWSESSLGTHAIVLVLSWGGSFFWLVCPCMSVDLEWIKWFWLWLDSVCLSVQLSTNCWIHNFLILSWFFKELTHASKWPKSYRESTLNLASLFHDKHVHWILHPFFMTSKYVESCIPFPWQAERYKIVLHPFPMVILKQTTSKMSLYTPDKRILPADLAWLSFY